MYFYNAMLDDRQYWYFENKESEREFDGTYGMNLTNIENEEG